MIFAGTTMRPEPCSRPLTIGCAVLAAPGAGHRVYEAGMCVRTPMKGTLSLNRYPQRSTLKEAW